MCFFILQLVALPDDHEVNFSTPIPRVCYDIPGTDPAICPATQYGLPRNVNILTYPVLNTTWDMDANIAWFPPPLPGPQYPLPVLYYVDISNQIFFKTNATVKRDKCSRAKIIITVTILSEHSDHWLEYIINLSSVGKYIRDPLGSLSSLFLHSRSLD